MNSDNPQEPTLSSAADPDSNSPPVPPKPDYAPDIHKRTKPLRADWWRLASDNDQRQPPQAAPADDTAAPAQPEWWEYEDPAATKTSTPDDKTPPTEDSPNDQVEPPSTCAPTNDPTMTGPTGEGLVAAYWPPLQQPFARVTPAREALYEWWARRPAREQFVIRNGLAAACGAWGYGAFTSRWDVGIEQTVLAWMHEVHAAHPDSPAPLVVGGLTVIVAAVIGSAATAFVNNWLRGIPPLCTAVHWALARVPFSSTVIALLLYMN